jgi:hypothetical protein
LADDADPDVADPNAVNRSSRKVCKASRTWAGELLVLAPVEAVPLDATVVVGVSVLEGVALADVVVVTVVTGELVLAVTVAPAGLAEAVLAVPPVPKVWPKAWNTASITALMALSILPEPLPGALAVDCCEGSAAGVVATVLLVLVGVLTPLGPELPVRL